LQVVDQVEDHFVTLVQAQLLQDFLDLFWVDFSAVVLVEQVEGRFELLDFLL
jgi:hypothetical protein